MDQPHKKIVVVGAGIAGLCTAVYALKCGYEVEVLDMNNVTGGLAMSWRRGPYTFETCLHWLVGSREGEMHDLWKEIFDIDKLLFVDPEEFVRLETERGDVVRFYTNVDRLEEELLHHAPGDEQAIRELTHSIRALGRFHMMDPSATLVENWWPMLLDVPVLPQVMKLLKVSGSEYGSRFNDPLLKSFFATGDLGKLSSIAMILSLAWMNKRNAGYCIGGSQAIVRSIEKRIEELGGRIRLGAKVARILVDGDIAVGVQLTNGERINADWVVSAADGHATIFEMLDGRYADETVRRLYAEREVFASYLQVSLGIARDLSSMPSMLTRILDEPIAVDPGTQLRHLPFRFFHYDPTFAPAGSTAVTSILPTRNVSYWVDLRRDDLTKYNSEKSRVADAIVDVLDRRIPGVRNAIEVRDVSTPASVIRYTGNWKAAQEGWLIGPGDGIKMLPNRLRGLDKFLMVGQWIMPGGGLPSGPLTARPAVKEICREDHVPFNAHRGVVEPVGA